MRDNLDGPVATSPRAPASLPAMGCSQWVLWVLGLGASGVVSYLASSIMPLSGYTLPPVSILMFGALAGLVRGYLMRGPSGTLRQWVRPSALAGLGAAILCILPTGLAATSDSLYAGWAYAWAAYAAILGVLHERHSPERRWLLPCVAAWTMAGIMAGLVGWYSDVMRIAGTTELRFHIASSMTRAWSRGTLVVVGATLGITGGMISATTLAIQSRQRAFALDALDEKSKRLTLLAGIVSGSAAALLGTLVSPILVTILLRGSLASVELVTFMLNLVASSVLCVPTYVVVTVPLATACARAGLCRALALGERDVRPRVWLGAALGGIAGYLICGLVAFAIGAVD